MIYWLKFTGLLFAELWLVIAVWLYMPGAIAKVVAFLLVTYGIVHAHIRLRKHRRDQLTGAND